VKAKFEHMFPEGEEARNTVEQNGQQYNIHVLKDALGCSYLGLFNYLFWLSFLAIHHY
jgi:hypothetical protein